MITGKATPDGTATWSRDHPQLGYRPLFAGGPLVSQAGFGTYRTIIGHETHHQALSYALTHGINLIDTSSNYGDGSSERLVGQVLNELIGQGQLTREAVVVVSKGGYIQGQNLEIVRRRKEQGKPFANVVNYAEGLDHCIQPDFLADQIQRSRERLQLETIDGYLLHNPEYYLMWAAKWNRPLAESRRIYYQRIRMAFAYLEEAAGQELIRWYGISSNTFPARAQDPAFTSLAMVLEIAKSLSADHHFRVIQLPMNLLEGGAVSENNQPDDRCVLALARDQGLGVLINRPLNAFYQGNLTRLAEVVPPSYPTTPDEVSTAVDTLVKAEVNLQQKLLPQLDIPLDQKRSLLERLAIGRILLGQWRGFGSYQNWLDILSHYLVPRAQAALQSLSDQPEMPPEAAEWVEDYVHMADIAFAAVSAFYQEMAIEHIQTIKEKVSRVAADWAASTLSQTAVRALRSTAGITCVLVGMRRQSYVDDILVELSVPVEPQPYETAWERLSQ
jgi:aryl-alcohol dehydrogenase-like predicted oxidoreductase